MGHLAVIDFNSVTGNHPKDITNDRLHCTLLSKVSRLSFKSPRPQWGDQDFHMNCTFLPLSDSPYVKVFFKVM